MTASIHSLGFYTTPTHTCSYFKDRQAITMFADPRFPKSGSLYSQLAKYGFRRSGKHIYQPHCEMCTACIPVRIPVNDFIPNRNQKRTLLKNKELKSNILPAGFHKEHFNLYKRYLEFKHPGGGMDNPSVESYTDFLFADWMETIILEIYLDQELLAIAVIDQLNDSLSAVYTFYNPEFTERSLGTYAILLEIEKARELGLKWLYLGYWINGCKKMSYKNNFNPLEYYINNAWTLAPKHYKT